MTWPIASTLGAGLAVVAIAVGTGPVVVVACVVLAANAAALIRHCRPKGPSDWSCGYDAGVQAERKRAVQAVRDVIAARGQS